jgi:hypothetical protein
MTCFYLFSPKPPLLSDLIEMTCFYLFSPKPPLSIGFITFSSFHSGQAEQVLKKHRPEVVQFFAPTLLKSYVTLHYLASDIQGSADSVAGNRGIEPSTCKAVWR